MWESLSKLLPCVIVGTDTKEKRRYISYSSYKYDLRKVGNKEIDKLPDKNQLILVYCRSGNRSKQASEKLVKLGYTNVVEFGGINDWTGETVTGK